MAAHRRCQQWLVALGLAFPLATAKWLGFTISVANSIAAAAAAVLEVALYRHAFSLHEWSRYSLTEERTDS